MTYRSVSTDIALMRAAHNLDDRILALFTPTPDYLERFERLGLHRLKAELTQLSHTQLRLLLLTVLQSFTVGETSAALGLSETSITRALADAREQLRAPTLRPAYKECSYVR